MVQMSWGSILGAIFLHGCGSLAPVSVLSESGQFGRVQLHIATAPEVARVHVVVTAAAMATVEEDFPAVDNTVNGLLAIKAGNSRSFAATAYNAGQQAIYASLPVVSNVPANAVTVLVLTLQSLAQGAPSGWVSLGVNFNHQPDIRWVRISPGEPHRNRDVDLQVEAGDVDGDPLSFVWTVTSTIGNPSGTLTNANTADATWRTPGLRGDYRLTVEVSDGNGGVNNDSVFVQVR